MEHEHVCLDVLNANYLYLSSVCAFRQKSTGDLVAQGSHVEYSAGDDAYPDSTAEYHNITVARQKSKL